MQTASTKLYVFFGFCLVVLAATFLYNRHLDREVEVQTSELSDDGQTVTTIVALKLASTSELLVTRLSGRIKVDAKADRLWGWMTSSMTATMPATVIYTVPLSKVSGDDFEWDSKRRLLVIAVPDVVVSPPNIDESEAVIENEQGIIVTRSQSNEMRKSISSEASKRVSREARRPDRINEVRERARREIQRLFLAPVEAAGMDDVRIEVRFPSDPRRTSEQWDISKSVDEVLANRR